MWVRTDKKKHAFKISTATDFLKITLSDMQINYVGI